VDVPTFLAILGNDDTPGQDVKAYGIFRFRDLGRLGLTRSRLRGMLLRGEAERLGRGLYRRGGRITELDTVATVCARVPGAIVCLLSALLIHRIGTQLPNEVWIAIDRKARRPRVADLPVRIVRFSGPMLRHGIDVRRVQGVRVRITSPARTVVDCFRYRNKIGPDIALEALKDALATRRASVDEIAGCARACRVFTVIRPYLEAMLA
jgi:predicted transcriptional regulator of viral defense system